MQAMVILKRCRDAVKEIARINLRIRQREALATGISAPALDPNRVGRGGGDPDKNGRLTAEIVDLKEEKKRRQERMAVEMASSCALVDFLPELESAVLYGYYVLRKDTDEIARDQRYQPGYIRRIKRQGEEIMRMLDPEKVNATLPRWYLEEYGDERREKA